MLYRPAASVTTDRTFSISAGLVASTVTQGTTAPDASVMAPAIPLACCAHADDDSATYSADVSATPIGRPKACLKRLMAPPNSALSVSVARVVNQIFQGSCTCC